MSDVLGNPCSFNLFRRLFWKSWLFRWLIMWGIMLRWVFQIKRILKMHALCNLSFQIALVINCRTIPEVRLGVQIYFLVSKCRQSLVLWVFKPVILILMTLCEEINSCGFVCWSWKHHRNRVLICQTSFSALINDIMEKVEFLVSDSLIILSKYVLV